MKSSALARGWKELMFHHRVPFVNHRHRFQTAGILLRSIPSARFYFYTVTRQCGAQKGSISANEAKRFLTSAEYVRPRLRQELFFSISRIFSMPTSICILTKEPWKKVINKKHLGTNTGLKARSIEAASDKVKFTTKMVDILVSFCNFLEAQVRA